jgi:hypothetical protein
VIGRITAHQHLATLGSLGGADHAAGLEVVEEPRRARIADLEPALQHGRGRLAVQHHDPHRLFQELVVALRLFQRPNLLQRRVVGGHGPALLFQERDHALDLLARHV